MTNPNTTAAAGVTQADRDIAEPFQHPFGWETWSVGQRAVWGYGLVQAFARHRQQAFPAGAGDIPLGDGALDGSIQEVAARFPNWQPTPAMIGFARAALAAAPHPAIAEEVERVLAHADEALHNLIVLARPHFSDEVQMLALSEAAAALVAIRAQRPEREGGE